ncbi:uncharacterized protein KY384_007277 [Bacidia gigantensis]|uniref:uncharacterized protein n=1 Tax=Bacidia gigantensis TaxID=2732470 RepID=UPI001D05872C|nr:uncharacterized protein KY384_007277 [Bacidia gigantensis]KAG8528359.1 hypothetical protein KY384_007277 [Bacidia gigantensis]
MYSSTTATLSALLISCLSLSGLATTHTHQFHTSTYKLPNYWVPSANQKTQNVLNLKHKPDAKPHNQGYLQALRNGSQVNGVFGYEEVDVTANGLVFATEVDIGGTTYELVVDTGSSDTWLPKSNYQCSRPGTGDILPQSSCQLASTYTQSSTFYALNNLNFFTQYTDGETLRGTFGVDQVTVAGIKVKNQQIALVDNAAWNGDGSTSGLLGLAFPAATKAFTGADYRLDTPATQKIYNPVFTNMYTEGHVAPLFSIALDRNYGGQLAIGGLPPVAYLPIFASSPFQLLTTSNTDQVGTASSSAYTLYTITTEGFDYEGASTAQWSYTNFPNPFDEPSDHTQVQVIIDTATSNLFLPAGTADAINKLFSPAPLYKTTDGFYVVNCNAKPPQFGVKIGFETFYINSKDMIINLGNGKCVSGVAASATGGASILGHTFLKNVLAIFDVGAQMMRFAARSNY